MISLNSVVASAQLQQNQDNTLRGGFLSVTGGRYRIIIGADGNPSAAIKENAECNGTNTECSNTKCPTSTNTVSCSNDTCVAVGSVGGHQSY